LLLLSLLLELLKNVIYTIDSIDNDDR
jgi:hypothetical protein